MRRSIIAVIASAILLLDMPALGASDEDRDNCNQTANHDLRIDGCTRVLNDGKEPPPHQAIAYNLRGGAWLIKRDLDRAIADFDRAIGLDGTLAEAYNNRGSVRLFWKRDRDRAIADFDQAIRLNPEYAAPYYNRGAAWLEKREFDRAIADFDEALKIDPKLERALHGRGLAKLRKGDDAGGNADIAAAGAIRKGIAGEPAK
jgi:tetratricopeptide (TPR) repeat protein